LISGKIDKARHLPWMPGFFLVTKLRLEAIPTLKLV
jgi:hypothetical protein